MPRREMHDIFEEAFLGEITGMTAIMDAPSKTLKARHRAIYHDIPSVIMISLLKGGNIIQNIKAGLLHLALDNSLSEGKRAVKKYNKKGR
jgi:hypothetical protein